MHETFEHTADLGLRVTATKLEELFEEAAVGLFSILVAGSPQSGGQERQFHIPGDKREFLLIDWLGELLSLFASKQVCYEQFSVQIDSTGIHARAREHSLASEEIRVLTEIKAVTYHGLKLERSERGWLAEIILDL